MWRWTGVLLRLSAPLGLLAFWCGMAAAAYSYPEDYDWRYQTISVLLYSDHNPRGYLLAWAGLELCGLSGIAWATDLKRRLESASGGSAVRGLRILQAGFTCMCSLCCLIGYCQYPKGMRSWPSSHSLESV